MRAAQRSASHRSSGSLCRLPTEQKLPQTVRAFAAWKCSKSKVETRQARYCSAPCPNPKTAPRDQRPTKPALPYCVVVQGPLTYFLLCDNCRPPLHNNNHHTPGRKERRKNTPENVTRVLVSFLFSCPSSSLIVLYPSYTHLDLLHVHRLVRPAPPASLTLTQKKGG